MEEISRVTTQDILFQTQVGGFHQGFQTQEHDNAFIVFECLETIMKPDAQVFEIASQLQLRKKIEVFTNFSHVGIE